MAQQEQHESETLDSTTPSLSRSVSGSRLNAKAPEFVPHQQQQQHRLPSPSPPPTVYHHHHYPPFHHPHFQRPHFYPTPPPPAGFVVVEDASAAVAPSRKSPPPPPPDPDSSSSDPSLKIINQVEYYFSDMNLATTDHLMRYINKDPEGYVPISVVASFKKIKALSNSHSHLAGILRNSGKLVVSEDGKKIRRLHPLTESDMEEIQCRIVVAENLPEDHCHQNLMKVFSAVGSVRTIRTCQPQPSSSGASSASRTVKADGTLFSNKLHAFVEYETVELAEKAVLELNDEDNWRNGLRVRLLLKRSVKPAQARAKKLGHESDSYLKENDTSTSEQHEPNGKHPEDPSQQSDKQLHEHAGEEQATDKEGGHRKGRNRGRGKGRGRGQYHNHRGGNVPGAPQHNSNSISSFNTEHAVGTAKQPAGPRMPDGTRGFAMGRGKPISVSIT